MNDKYALYMTFLKCINTMPKIKAKYSNICEMWERYLTDDLLSVEQVIPLMAQTLIDNHHKVFKYFD